MSRTNQPLRVITPIPAVCGLLSYDAWAFYIQTLGCITAYALEASTIDHRGSAIMGLPFLVATVIEVAALGAAYFAIRYRYTVVDRQADRQIGEMMR